MDHHADWNALDNLFLNCLGVAAGFPLVVGLVIWFVLNLRRRYRTSRTGDGSDP
jgi:hypothetical protein